MPRQMDPGHSFFAHRPGRIRGCRRCLFVPVCVVALSPKTIRATDCFDEPWVRQSCDNLGLRSVCRSHVRPLPPDSSSCEYIVI